MVMVVLEVGVLVGVLDLMVGMVVGLWHGP
jgi:ABC-type dipeptide/oligopeptide/nickel transport system permease subunit